MYVLKEIIQNIGSEKIYVFIHRMTKTEESDSDGVFDALVTRSSLTNASFGSVVGYCSGAAAKKVGKVCRIVSLFVHFNSISVFFLRFHCHC